MIEGIIYRYKSPSGKYYIGQTIDEESRRRCFLSLNVVYGGPKIELARKKYGPKNFEYVVLMKVTGDNKTVVKSYLDKLEHFFIKKYNSISNGYNSTEGGEGTVGYQHTESWKKNFSEYLKGNKFNLGKTRTEKTKKKISEATKGKPKTKESIQKMKESLKGRVSWNKGLKLSEEHKNKLKGLKKGKHRVYNPDGTYHYE